MTTEQLPDHSFNPTPSAQRHPTCQLPMRYLVAIVVLMLASSDASAKKCVARFFQISGTVVGMDGRPVPGAMVGVSWTVPAVPRGPALALANDLGEFSIPVRFSPLECARDSIEFAVSAYTSSHFSQSEVVKTSPGIGAIAVPRLRIDSEIHRSPVWPDEAGG